MSKHNRLSRAFVVGGFSGFLAMPSIANSSEYLEEIVVTATKQGETSLQDTAIAISAYSEDLMRDANIRNITDLAAISPSLTSGDFASRQITTIRGIGTNWTFGTGDVSVPLNVDGVYMPRAYSHFASFLDVERVEVLRGPQGTLYGRNATGGAINVISRDPGDQLEGEIRVSFGEYNFRGVEAVVTGPISDGIAGSLAVSKSERDGFLDNVYPGRKDLMDEDRRALRGKLVFTPSDSVQIKLSYDRVVIEDMPTFGPKAVNDFGQQQFSDFWTVSHDEPEGQRIEDEGGSVTVIWDVNEDVSLRSVSAYRESSTWYGTDLDASELSILFQDPLLEENEYFMQEFQLSGAKDKLDWIFGVFYFNEDAIVDLDLRLRGTGLSFTQKSDPFESEAWAVYGQFDYAFNARWSVAFGLRYSKDNKENILSTNGLKETDPEEFLTGKTSDNPFVADYPIVQHDDEDWSALTPQVSVKYHPYENTLIYASATKGYKVGGFNFNPAAGEDFLRPWDEETVWNYEIGLKTDFADGKARLNTAVFYMDFSDFQVLQSPVVGSDSSLGFSNVNLNAPGATVSGAELELLAMPTPQLTITANMSLLEAEYDGEFFTVSAPTGEVVNGDGKKLSNAPEFTANIAIEYVFEKVGPGSVKVRGDYSYKDDVFYTPDNNDLEAEDSYGLFNLHVSYLTDRWTFSLHAENLSDEEYLRGVSFIGPAALGLPGAPRMVSGEIGYRF